MEKLIELLNEYELKQVENAEGLDVSKVWIMDGTLHYYDNYKDELVFDNIDLLIISARYGFIERLVKNDKIKWRDKTELYYNISCYDWDGGEYELIGPDFTDTEQIIMILSIQDNPIEYLCSILKE